jgi:hypothetical protein
VETQSTASNPASEWWAKTTESLKNVSAFFHDRRALLNSSGHTAIEDARPLRNSPLQFAMLSIMIPVLLTGLVVKLIAIRDLPPTGIERVIASDRKVETTSDELMAALRPPVLASYRYYTPGSMSNEELDIESKRQRNRIAQLRQIKAPTSRDLQQIAEVNERLFELAVELVRTADAPLLISTPKIEHSFQQDRLWFSAVVKVSALEEWAFPLIVGLSLIMSAYTFRFLLSRKPFQLAGGAHSAYLYVVGATLFFPHLAAATTSSVFDFADRYQWTWYPGLEVAIFGLIWIWSLIRLRTVARILVNILHVGPGNASKLETKIGNRMIISQTLSLAAISGLIAVVGAPIFYLILKFEGA